MAFVRIPLHSRVLDSRVRLGYQTRIVKFPAVKEAGMEEVLDFMLGCIILLVLVACAWEFGRAVRQTYAERNGPPRKH